MDIDRLPPLLDERGHTRYEIVAVSVATGRATTGLDLERAEALRKRGGYRIFSRTVTTTDYVEDLRHG